MILRLPLPPEEFPFDLSIYTCLIKPVPPIKTLGRCRYCRGPGVPFPTTDGGTVDVFPFRSTEAAREFQRDHICQQCQDAKA